jgi:hypothetical protein
MLVYQQNHGENLMSVENLTINIGDFEKNIPYG